MWNQQEEVSHHHLMGPMGVSPYNTSLKKFCKLTYECPYTVLGCKHIFFGVNKIYYWKLLYITQNWYCGRFIQRSENLACNGNDNIDNHNQPQFEHEWDSVCIMCANLCSTSAFHQLNFWFQCKHVTNGQYSYFPFCYLNSLLFSSFRTWFVYIFFSDLVNRKK